MALMGKYIYCFIEEKEKVTFGNSQIGNLNAPVYTINYKELAAVVSDAPLIEYDPKRKNILAHQQVITKVMEKYTVIPVAFGTVANNKKEVERIITSYFEQFNKNIDYLENKRELGLRVTWNKDAFNEDIEDKEIIELKNKISGKEEKEVLTDKIRLGQLVEAAIIEKREMYKEEIFEPLAKIAIDSKLKEKLPIKAVLNGYFLVEKSKEEQFDKKVEELTAKYQNKLELSYTGPWPPYNFINMNINLNEV